MTLHELKQQIYPYFILLTAENQTAYRLVEDFYKKNIAPIYGDQKKALKKLLNGIDRKCELLTRENNIYDGVVVYKNELIQEFSNLGLSDIFELKSMFLLNTNKKTAGFMFAMLLKRIAEKAISLNAHQITCTVSSERKNVLKLLEKFGFYPLEIMKNKYVIGINEYRLIDENITKLSYDLDYYLKRNNLYKKKVIN